MIIKFIKRKLVVCGVIAGILFALIILLNLYMILTTFSDIVTVEEAKEIEKVDCIIVLGAAVRPDGTPSLMLKDRLDKAAELYEEGVSDKIIVSGDHREADYDEVNTMKRYLIETGIPSEAVYMDHAGLSTYDTMYRAVNVFGVESAVIVTQNYHIYRSVHNAESLGIEAYGVSTKDVAYSGQTYREFREVIARVKDILCCIFEPEATVASGSVSLDESGDLTND